MENIVYELNPKVLFSILVCPEVDDLFMRKIN